MNDAQGPSAADTLDRLRKLSAATVTTVSPRKRAKVMLRGGRVRIELRAEGFQTLDPEVLAEEVTHAFSGALRGYHGAERRILDEYHGAQPPRPTGTARERRIATVRRARKSIAVTATSASRMVRGEWTGTGGVSLDIKAVNESHRERLAEELSAVLNEMSEKYELALHRGIRGAADPTT